MRELKVKKIHPDAMLPKCAHPGEDLAFDVYALEDCVLYPHQYTKVRTGIAVEMTGYGFIVRERSSQAQKGIVTSGGTIDAGYRGELFVSLNFRPNYLTGPSVILRKGDRIAQIIPVMVQTADINVVEYAELSTSQRGHGGYGSTGR